MPMSELKDGGLENLDLEKSAINPFNELRKLLNIFLNKLLLIDQYQTFSFLFVRETIQDR